ncbi:molybdopterin dinucleotide binding domain-containing protein, partial [Chloroflexota bacterium]
EAYWRPFLDVRVPIYIHELAYYGPTIKKLAEKAGVHANWEQYDGLVNWYPTPPNKASEDYDLYCLSYRDILHTGSGTMQLPLVDEASMMNPYTYNIVINTETAQKKGLVDGDIVEIESNHSRKIRGPINTTHGVHPDVISIAATAGHWVKGQPIAYKKGVHFDKLVELDMEHVDPTNLNMETSVKVKICKIDGREH